MTDEAVPLHFSESKAPSSGSSFSWLTGEHLHLSPGSRMHLVGDHVVQFLVVDDADEEVSGKLLSSDPVVQGFSAAILKS